MQTDSSFLNVKVHFPTYYCFEVHRIRLLAYLLAIYMYILLDEPLVTEHRSEWIVHHNRYHIERIFPMVRCLLSKPFQLPSNDKMSVYSFANS